MQSHHPIANWTVIPLQTMAIPILLWNIFVGCSITILETRKASVVTPWFSKKCAQTMVYLNEKNCVSTDWKTSLPLKGGIYCSPDHRCVIVLFPTCNFAKGWLVGNIQSYHRYLMTERSLCEHFWTDNVLRSMKWYESAKCLFETSWPCSYNSHSLWNWYIPLLSLVYLLVAGCLDQLSCFWSNL